MPGIGILKALKSQHTRTSAQTALARSGETPNSGNPALNNSQGFSATASELVSEIGFVIDQLDIDGEPADDLQPLLDRLAEAASTYENSTLKAQTGEPWECDGGLAALVFVSCICSVLTYTPKGNVMTPNGTIRRINHNSASMIGTVKATAIWVMDCPPSGDGSGRTLIFSIQGSDSKVDHMVNFNDRKRDVEALFVLDSSGPIFAHAGFLNCAKAMAPRVLKDLITQVSLDPTISNIIFTGHSAGGAVASILFLHCIQYDHPKLSTRKFSLCTFGSPPVFDSCVTLEAANRQNVGILLAVVKEHDIVARADGAYCKSLIDMYKEQFRPAARQVLEAGQDEAPEDATTHGLSPSRPAWPLPQPLYHLLGDIVILKHDTQLHRPTVGEGTTNAGGSTPAAAVKVSSEDFGQLLYADFGVHGRAAYLDASLKLWQNAFQRRDDETNFRDDITALYNSARASTRKAQRLEETTC